MYVCFGCLDITLASETGRHDLFRNFQDGDLCMSSCPRGGAGPAVYLQCQNWGAGVQDTCQVSQLQGRALQKKTMKKSFNNEISMG